MVSLVHDWACFAQGNFNNMRSAMAVNAERGPVAGTRLELL